MERPSNSSSDMRDQQEEPANNRKRSGEPPMEALPAKRSNRTETRTASDPIEDQLDTIYRQLTSNVKIGADILRLFCNIFKFSYPCVDKVVLVDPLWFSTGKGARGRKSSDFKGASIVVFPAHHKGHWTLCVAYFSHSNPREMNVYHYDSLQNEERYTAVCAQILERAEKSGLSLDYKVNFQQGVCNQQGDRTGIYVLSCLRYTLQFKPDTEVVTPGAERNQLINLIKSDQDFELGEEESRVRWGLKKMIEDEEYRLSQKFMQSTLESLERDAQEAKERLERAQKELSCAEEKLIKAIAKKEGVVETRNDLAEALRDVAETDVSQNTESINTSQATDSDLSNTEDLLRSVNLIVGNYTQTRNIIPLSRVDKMVERFEGCIENASGAVSRNRDKEAIAQCEVTKMERMVQVKRSLGDGGGGLTIKMEFIV